MPIELTLDLEEDAADLITGYGAAARIYIERDTTAAFLAPTTINGPVLVAGTQQYEHWNDTGLDSHYYRSRVGDSGATKFTSWSDAFRGTELFAYASIQDVVQSMQLPGQDRYAYLSSLLKVSSSAVDDICARRFYRDPQVSGTGSWTLDVLSPGHRSLAFASMGMGFSDGQALDIVSVTTLEYRDDETSAYVVLVSGTDFLLQPGAGMEPGWPYEDVVLMETGALTSWPTGLRASRMTGVRGFTRVPSRINRAVANEVREQYRQGPLGQSAPQGVNQFGVPMFLSGHPIDWREVMTPRVAPYAKRGWSIH